MTTPAADDLWHYSIVKGQEHWHARHNGWRGWIIRPPLTQACKCAVWKEADKAALLRGAAGLLVSDLPSLEDAKRYIEEEYFGLEELS